MEQIRSAAGQGGYPAEQHWAGTGTCRGRGTGQNGAMGHSSQLNAGSRQETAQIISTRLGIGAVVEVPALFERDYGTAEGTNITGFDEATKRSLMERGESDESVVFRGPSALNWLKSVYPGQRLVIVSHGMLLRLLPTDLSGKEHPRVANGEVTESCVNLIQCVGARMPPLR